VNPYRYGGTQRLAMMDLLPYEGNGGFSLICLIPSLTFAAVGHRELNMDALVACRRALPAPSTLLRAAIWPSKSATL
jgi:hypothetical protein